MNLVLSLLPLPRNCDLHSHSQVFMSIDVVQERRVGHIIPDRGQPVEHKDMHTYDQNNTTPVQLSSINITCSSAASVLRSSQLQRFPDCCRP